MPKSVFAGIALTLFGIFYPKGEQKVHTGDSSQISSKEDGSQISDIAALPEKGETSKAGAVVIVVLLAVIAIMGVYMPAPLKDLITSAQRIITGV